MASEQQPKCKYYLPDEVVIHYEESSAWVIIHGVVIDVSTLFAKKSPRNRPLRKTLQWLLALAGTDLSSFFHKSLDPVERTNRNGERVPVFVPSLERNPATQLLWHRDPALVIGRITFHPCPVKIINTLTFSATEMIVCYEDTIDDVREKYLRYNDNARQYEWRKDRSVGTEVGLLRMDRTLVENGYQVDRRGPVPVIWIFYILPPGSTDAGSDRAGDMGRCSGRSSPPSPLEPTEDGRQSTTGPGLWKTKSGPSTHGGKLCVGEIHGGMVEKMTQITIE